MKLKKISYITKKLIYTCYLIYKEKINITYEDYEKLVLAKLKEKKGETK